MNDLDAITQAAGLEPPAGGDQSAAVPETRTAPPGVSVGGAPADTQPFRPKLRRSMALVHVIDDGREGGEVVRMRGDRLVIGRADGDIVIPHDICMSPKHAAIERLDDGAWMLFDLGSSNGTFVRVVTARLVTGTVVQVGRTRLLFEEAGPTSASLVERPAGGGVDRRHECPAPGVTIGRAGGGSDIVVGDAMVSPVHAAIQWTPRGWQITNSGWNGLWVRINQPVRIVAPSQFLCGEQRFVFEPLG